MTIMELLKDVKTLNITGGTEVGISGLSYDSRKIKPGDVFVAVSGEKFDGNEFIPDAINSGARAVVYDRQETASAPAVKNASATLIHVEDSRTALAAISNNFYKRPSLGVKVIGITGTNGKTTTAYLIKSILETWGKKTGLIGTIQYMIKDKVFDAVHTTPEAPEFQELLQKMLVSGCEYAVTEVSSHALVQKRVDNTAFRTGVFTNLTSEHLDFHKSIESYFSAKARFFSELLHRNAPAVINYDDIWGRKLMGLLSGSMLSFGLETGSDFMATDIKDSSDGLEFNIVTGRGNYRTVSRLVGLPNVYNILSAAGAASSLGVPWEAIIEGVRNAGTVRGRFEKVEQGQGFLAVVDYAHTEDALERLIYTARGLTKGKIITVFGCGGDRDRAKRPRMGAIATRLSDSVIITSDNPRSEDPGIIMKEIEAGAVRRNYLMEPDRRDAIRRAVLMASEGDVVLIAGKGHETYQEIMGRKHKFNDREVLEESIRQFTNNA